MTEDTEVDNFKKTFKYYKSKQKSPDLSRVVNLKDGEPEKFDFTPVELQFGDKDRKNHVNLDEIGLIEPSKWKIYKSSKHEGLLFIVNPFTAAGQRYWIQRCYVDYPNAPNVTNLDSAKINKQQQQHTWKYLRWVTLGYHHNWDTKVYSLESHTQFPRDLSSLTEFFAEMLGFPPFFAEAAIVNFYHLDSTLAGHVDRSEFDLDAPLFSISFGSPAIFLLGGQTKSEEPSAMMLNSGDVVVMSGKSRLSYHAVPKILASKETPWLETQSCKNEKPEWSHVKGLIAKSRLNLNVRQVFSH